MKVSYFYMVRFFKPNQIPLSTAVWDPKWFHAGKGNRYNYLDKGGVINGLRLDELSPNSCEGDSKCPCAHQGDRGDYECAFLKDYGDQLDNMDFNKFIKKLELVCDAVKKKMGFDEEPEAVLIVYETPNNSCSERVMLKRWFEKNGADLDEFELENVSKQPWESRSA